MFSIFIRSVRRLRDHSLSPRTFARRLGTGIEVLEPRTPLAIDNLIHNFDGLSQNEAPTDPPDTVGDVGTHDYVQMTNGAVGVTRASLFSVHDKATGTRRQGPTQLRTLAPANTECASGGFDPIVLYDALADRWLLSEVSVVNNWLCVYISKTADPAGQYHPYAFDTPGRADFPKYGVWPDAYYVGVIDVGVGIGMYALDRANMLQGLAARPFQRFAATSGRPIWPSDLDGETLPPVGAPNFFVRRSLSANAFELTSFHVDFANPSLSTLTSFPDVPYLVAPFSPPVIPQPGTSTLLGVGADAQSRVQYRNQGSFGTLVTSFSGGVDNGNEGDVGWVELRRVGSGNWTLYQQGQSSFDGTHRWLSMAAMDGAGNIALGYNVSNDGTPTPVYPGLRYTGRRASDPLNAMPLGEHVLMDGSGVRSGPPVMRWGDYTAISVDPVDDMTFWFTGEYVAADGTWWTRIGAFTIYDPDVNGDESVDRADVAILAANYGRTSGATHAQGDVNGDGRIDSSDLHFTQISLSSGEGLVGGGGGGESMMGGGEGGGGEEISGGESGGSEPGGESLLDSTPARFYFTTSASTSGGGALGSSVPAITLPSPGQSVDLYVWVQMGTYDRLGGYGLDVRATTPGIVKAAESQVYNAEIWDTEFNEYVGDRWNGTALISGTLNAGGEGAAELATGPGSFAIGGGMELRDAHDGGSSGMLDMLYDATNDAFLLQRVRLEALPGSAGLSTGVQLSIGRLGLLVDNTTIFTSLPIYLGLGTTSVENNVIGATDGSTHATIAVAAGSPGAVVAQVTTYDVSPARERLVLPLRATVRRERATDTVMSERRTLIAERQGPDTDSATRIRRPAFRSATPDHGAIDDVFIMS